MSGDADLEIDPDAVRWDPDTGLVPAIVQDADTRQVVMLGWMDAAALRRTIERGRVTFWSRSRSELWEKGETSGNTLELVGASVDCDADAILVLARPAGPTCHTGSVSCFDPRTRGWDEREPGFARLERLQQVIAARDAQRPPGSYTTRLLADGPDLPARKVAEEATEVLMAAKDHAVGAADARRVAEEAADLVYHLLVLLRERGVSPGVVLDVLDQRADG